MSAGHLDDAHRDHALALALRASGDPVPIADLAVRARNRAEVAAAGVEERLARGRRIVRGIEAGGVVVIAVLAVVLLSGLDFANVFGGNGAVSSTGDSDPWVEAGWIAAAACIAAIVYAVIARAEPLAAPATGRRTAA